MVEAEGDGGTVRVEALLALEACENLRGVFARRGGDGLFAAVLG